MIKRKRIVFEGFLLENKSMRWRQGLVAVVGLVSLYVMVIGAQVYASQAASSNYSVDQVFMGSGGELNACSSNYCSKQTAGEIAAGNAAGTAFRTQAGFNTDRDPYLAFSVAAGATDLGYLSTVGTATTTGTFAVKTYLANGYVVRLASSPPKNNGTTPHTFSAPSTPTAAATPGTAEQFGINLVQNRTSCATPAPANFGADPVQVPDNTFSFGTVASGYNTCGLFKYVKGDTIAQSTRSSGETDYTISFIYNITTVTPNGQYTFNGDLVTTSTY
jgi:hypothetical protein